MKKLLLGMALLVSVPAFADTEVSATNTRLVTEILSQNVRSADIRVALVHQVKELMRKMAIRFLFNIDADGNKDADYTLSNIQSINERCRMICTIVKIEDDKIVYVLELSLLNNDGEFEVASTATVSTTWGQEAVICISDSGDEDAINPDENLFIIVVAQKNDEDAVVIDVDGEVVDSEVVAVDSDENEEVTNEEVVTEVVAEEVATEEVAS